MGVFLFYNHLIKADFKRDHFLFVDNLTVTSMIKILGISTSTYYTYKKELKEAEGQIPGQTRLADW